MNLAQLDEKMTSPMLKDSISLRVYSRASNISAGLNKCVDWNFFEILMKKGNVGGIFVFISSGKKVQRGKTL